MMYHMKNKNLLCYNLFNLLIKKSIKRLLFISYSLILKNLDYGRNNKCYIIIIYFFGGAYIIYPGVHHF
jgi:hypothetical protein